MRTLFAFILGIAVTIGGAYIYDTFLAGSGANARPMVNWDVVKDTASSVVESAHSQWNKLTSK
jgi:hypothetical protein